ncbi:MAG: UPF0175 family protein [Lewinellaceae bacterium]|nr:UPF0175 family protein [Phaeodactylibacter sp.]MCB9039626.1 UPF0175 family protein [Lewinellaceae bacterium]
MAITISDDIIKRAGLSEEAFKIEVAILLFEKYLFTFGQASEFAGLSQYSFQQELGKRGLFIHYDTDDLKEDLKTLESLRK